MQPLQPEFIDSFLYETNVTIWYRYASAMDLDGVRMLACAINDNKYKMIYRRKKL